MIAFIIILSITFGIGMLFGIGVCQIPRLKRWLNLEDYDKAKKESDDRILLNVLLNGDH